MTTESFNDALIELENLQLAEQITALGGNANVSPLGVGRNALLNTNEVLRNRLNLLQTPLRQGGPTVAEVQAEIGPGASRFIFPDAPVAQNPTGGGFRAILGDLLTPIVGLPQQDIQNLPAPVQPVVRGAQTVSAPASILGTVAAPAALGASGLAQGTGRGAATARFFGDTPGRALAGELGAEIAAESAAQAGAPTPVVIGAGLAGGVGGALTPNIAAGARSAASDPRRAVDAVSPVGTARAASDDVAEGFVPPTVQVGDISAIGSVTPNGSVAIPDDAINLFGIRQPDADISLVQRQLNRVRTAIPGQSQESRAFARVLGNVRDETVDPIFSTREEIIRNARSRGVVTVQRVSPEYRRLFEPDDNGLIQSLAGVDPEIPVAPTIQDVAARLPRYVDALTPDQQAFMTSLRAELEPFANVLRQAGDDFGQRADIIDGGFYIPRGGTIADGADAPLLSGSRRPGSTPGFERTATRGSMAEGIAAGDQYLPFEQALGQGFIERSGRRVADLFTSNYLKTVRDADGTRLGRTAKELLREQNPSIVQAMDNLRARVTRIQSLISSKNTQLDQAAAKFLDDPAFSEVRHLDDLDRSLERINLISAVQTARREADELRPFAQAAQTAEPRTRRARRVQSGRNRGMDVADLRAEIRATREIIRRLKPEYEAGLRSVTRGRGTIGADALDFPQLNGRTFPERMAARANEILQEERQGLGALETANEIQNIFKGMQATLDDSGVGIQALLSGFSRNPRATARAIRVNIQSFRSQRAMADFLQQFNDRARARGLVTAEQWTDAGVRQLSPGDFDVTSTLPERLPGVGGAFRGANRAFATISNVVRLGWAEDLLIEELAKGRTLQQIADDGTLQRIARHVNTATGVVDGNFHVANLITFSARFLAARLATISRAIRGIDIDAPIDAIPVLGPRVARRIPRVNRLARLEDRLARRAILRMMAFGTMMTVALNNMQGRETDFRPTVDGRPNPNFMRFRWGRRDWSLFGPWDSLLRIFTSLGTGNVKSATRSFASAPGASLALDFIENRDFFGREIVDRDANFAKQSGDVLARFAETTVPFAAAEAPELLEQLAQGNGDSHLSNIGETGLTALGEAFGVKSSPLSTSELQELLRDPGLSPGARQAIAKEIEERRASRRSSASERLLPFVDQTPSRTQAEIIRGLR